MLKCNYVSSGGLLGTLAIDCCLCCAWLQHLWRRSSRERREPRRDAPRVQLLLVSYVCFFAFVLWEGGGWGGACCLQLHTNQIPLFDFDLYTLTISLSVNNWNFVSFTSSVVLCRCAEGWDADEKDVLPSSCFVSTQKTGLQWANELIKIYFSGSIYSKIKLGNLRKLVSLSIDPQKKIFLLSFFFSLMYEIAKIKKDFSFAFRSLLEMETILETCLAYEVVNKQCKCLAALWSLRVFEWRPAGRTTGAEEVVGNSNCGSWKS